jgi:hypothetical protein
MCGRLPLPLWERGASLLPASPRSHLPSGVSRVGRQVDRALSHAFLSLADYRRPERRRIVDDGTQRKSELDASLHSNGVSNFPSVPS